MKQLIVAVFFLSGCSGMNYAMQNYQGVEVIQFSHGDQEFRIFDKPSEGRLMITPTVGKAAVQGATFGAAATAENTYKQAAQAFLASSGRNCTTSDMMLIVQPQWEAFYTCS